MTCADHRAAPGPGIEMLPVGVGGRVGMADLPAAAGPVGRDHRLPVAFLTRGLAVQTAVVGVVGPGPRGGRPWLASGVLVTPGLLLTTHEVLPDRDRAARSVVRLDDGGGAVDPCGPRVGLDARSLFHTSPALGYTIVRVDDPAGDPRRWFGHPLPGDREQFAVGQLLNVVGHEPAGGGKELALQDDTVTAVLAGSIRYTSDTGWRAPGSAMFSNGWELVALHRTSGVEVDGVWVDNDAVRADAIVADLRAVLPSTVLAELAI